MGPLHILEFLTAFEVLKKIIRNTGRFISHFLLSSSYSSLSGQSLSFYYFPRYVFLVSCWLNVLLCPVSNSGERSFRYYRKLASLALFSFQKAQEKSNCVRCTTYRHRRELQVELESRIASTPADLKKKRIEKHLAQVAYNFTGSLTSKDNKYNKNYV